MLKVLKHYQFMKTTCVIVIIALYGVLFIGAEYCHHAGLHPGEAKDKNESKEADPLERTVMRVHYIVLYHAYSYLGSLFIGPSI
jgi:hypothetical protein